MAYEFDKETCTHLTIDHIYALEVNKNVADNHILDNKVYKVEGSEDILKKDSFNNIDLIEVSKNIYLQEYGELKVLHINAIIKNKDAIEFKDYNPLKCIPTVSDDKSTLFLEFEMKTFSFKLPVLINKELMEFLISKSENFSNIIELHIFNENNEIVSIKELFQGENNSSVAMTLIFKQLFG